MNDIPSNERTKALLLNWSDWARDCPPDWAEVDYYTVCAMLSQVLPRASGRPYDEESAMLVEKVMETMHKPYFQEWWILLAYYGEGKPQDEIAKRLGIAQSSVSRYRLPMARRIFAEQWARVIRESE